MALRPSLPSRDQAQREVFVREVDEAVRQDEMAGLARRYALPVLAVVAIALAVLAALLWWQHHRAAREGERGEQLTQALDAVAAGQLAAADTALAPLADAGHGASAAAAGLARGGLAEQKGDAAAAARLFAAVAADGDAPQPLRDLATVREVATRFDTLAPDQVIDRLKPLAVPGNAWFGSAGELVAIAYLKQGKRELAGPLFAAIARDTRTPASLRRRARQLAGLLGVDALDDVAKAISDQGDEQ